MVEVGDKVIVAPLDGQKDKMAVVTGPAGAGAVLNEGNYNTWTLEWINEPSNGLYNSYSLDVLIDEKNGVLSIAYKDGSSTRRFAIYNISDFSVVYESPLGDDYIYSYPNLSIKAAINFGFTYLEYGGISRSIQTYLLLLRGDERTIEVWRGGASALWSRDTQTDLVNLAYCDQGGISLTGKYVLVVGTEGASPYGKYLMLYKGSYVEP